MLIHIQLGGGLFVTKLPQALRERGALFSSAMADREVSAFHNNSGPLIVALHTIIAAALH